MIFSKGTSLLLLTAFLVAGCGVERQTENYSLRGTADLTLSSDNHPHGFGRSECFLCHLPSNIHKVNRINAPNFYLADPLVKQYGLSSCRGCHGTNGVTQ